MSGRRPGWRPRATDPAPEPAVPHPARPSHGPNRDPGLQSGRRGTGRQCHRTAPETGSHFESQIVPPHKLAARVKHRAQKRISCRNRSCQLTATVLCYPLPFAGAHFLVRGGPIVPVQINLARAIQVAHATVVSIPSGLSLVTPMAGRGSCFDRSCIARPKPPGGLAGWPFFRRAVEGVRCRAVLERMILVVLNERRRSHATNARVQAAHPEARTVLIPEAASVGRKPGAIAIPNRSGDRFWMPS